LARPAESTVPPLLETARYGGATVINTEGAVIGEVAHVSGNSLLLALGGWRNVWGFIDFAANRYVQVPVRKVAFPLVALARSML
jgi:hypothetical protein